MKKKSSTTKAAHWIAEQLNEYAALIAAGKDVPGHTPASPVYWFCGLARETKDVWKHADCAALLSQDARTILLNDLRIQVG